jgi:hypothetical protein
VLHQSVLSHRARHGGPPATTMKDSANGSREMALAYGNAVVDFRGTRRGRPKPGEVAYVKAPLSSGSSLRRSGIMGKERDTLL